MSELVPLFPTDAPADSTTPDSTTPESATPNSATPNSATPNSATPQKTLTPKTPTASPVSTDASGSPARDAAPSVRTLSRSERDVLEQALEGASEFLADDLCAALLSDDERSREDAQKLLPLLAFGGAAVARVEATVFEAMLDAGRSAEERLRLAHAWKTALFDAARRPALEHGLNSERPLDRRVSAVALSAPGCEIGAKHARSLLDDLDHSVRLTAFAALIDTGISNHVVLLLDFAKSLDGDTLEQHLGAVIDLCDAAKACAFLDALLDAPCAHKRRLALVGHLIRPLTCAAALSIRALDDGDERVRMLALALLERDGGRTHLEPMLPLLGDTSPKVAAMARDVSQVLRRAAMPA